MNSVIACNILRPFREWNQKYFTCFIWGLVASSDDPVPLNSGIKRIWQMNEIEKDVDLNSLSHTYFILYIRNFIFVVSIFDWR